MKSLNSAWVAWIVVLIGFNPVQAQQAVVPFGGSVSSAGGSVSYTAGQVACAGIYAAGGIVTQGVQQPFEIFQPIGMEDAIAVLPVINLYPNPVRDFLTISLESGMTAGMHFRIYTTDGRLLGQQEISDPVSTVDLGALPPACYVLKVMSGDGHYFKTFKFIRN